MHSIKDQDPPKALFLCFSDLPDSPRRGTLLLVGATNPNSTTSTSGYPQPTISGFFVPAIWATTPGNCTDELHIHADHGGSVPAFAVWLRGPNKPVMVNKARLLVEVVDAMPHPNLQHGRLTKPRESTGHDLHLFDPAFPYLPFGRPTPYPHHFRRCQQRSTSAFCAGRSTPGVFVPHPEQGGGSMTKFTPSRLESLLEQFANVLEQTDLCRQERAQFHALLDALRIEVGLCQEVLA